MKVSNVFGVVAAAAALIFLPTTANAIEEAPEPTIEDSQPDWGYEWRDYEYEVICKTGEPGERIVWQRMYRPTEPELVDGVWVTYDDWQEWGYPEAAQTVYKPLEPGDCAEVAPPVEVVPEQPVPEEAPVEEEKPVLAETGFAVMPLLAAGAALTAGGAFLMRRAARSINEGEKQNA